MSPSSWFLVFLKCFILPKFLGRVCAYLMNVVLLCLMNYKISVHFQLCRKQTFVIALSVKCERSEKTTFIIPSVTVIMTTFKCVFHLCTDTKCKNLLMIIDNILVCGGSFKSYK